MKRDRERYYVAILEAQVKIFQSPRVEKYFQCPPLKLGSGNSIRLSNSKKHPYNGLLITMMAVELVECITFTFRWKVATTPYCKFCLYPIKIISLPLFFRTKIDSMNRGKKMKKGKK